ncbi:Calcium uniporter protein 4, mitochondrial [Sesamum alatum]|uniref:Calcium uniporter protein 4, mitochondrial n=1 Tax=Sesamum alatum TaxID=300844 RepID=A0AAE1YQ29_9LAMI|nr:Calcium uniporter protein 4, mitochondrial [Sesamum alatum]
MSLRRTLSKRLLGATTTLQQTPIPPPSKAPARSQFYRDFRASSGFFRQFLQRRAINNHSSPSFLTLPVGEKLREKLKSLNTYDGNRLRLDGLSPPLPPPPTSARFGVSVADAKRVLKFAQLEKIRERVRNIPASTIQHGEFVRICSDVCGNREAGLEFAKALDESGNVIVLGGVVFLRPDQVAKSMERLISESIGLPNDPRREELGRLENQKAQIDKKAQSLVRGELYCGLGFLAVQTLGFMRLTFWELSWDVMEPICFFVTSFHFALAYVFFSRTSTEPSFEGYFHRRFKVKQKKLMKIHNFDVERYNQLSQAFYPKY